MTIELKNDYLTRPNRFEEVKPRSDNQKVGERTKETKRKRTMATGWTVKKRTVKKGKPLYKSSGYDATRKKSYDIRRKWRNSGNQNRWRLVRNHHYQGRCHDWWGSTQHSKKNKLNTSWRGRKKFQGLASAPGGRIPDLTSQKEEIVRIELISLISQLIEGVNLETLICILADLKQ